MSASSPFHTLAADACVLVLPGLGNSGPAHWQTLWERADARFRRVEQRDWDRPSCDEWAAVLERAVASAPSEVLLAAHSLACVLVAHWATHTAHAQRVRGALLVAPPDPDGITFPEEATGFSPLPVEPLPFASIVVASSDDPYNDIDFARACARHWHSRFVDAGARGHLNAESGLGQWEEGLALLASLG